MKTLLWVLVSLCFKSHASSSPLLWPSICLLCRRSSAYSILCVLLSTALKLNSFLLSSVGTVEKLLIPFFPEALPRSKCLPVSGSTSWFQPGISVPRGLGTQSIREGKHGWWHDGLCVQSRCRENVLRVSLRYSMCSCSFLKGAIV